MIAPTEFIDGIFIESAIMTKYVTPLAATIFAGAMLTANLALAENGHLGKIETIGIKTGMTHEEVKQVLAKIKKPWRPAGPTNTGALFENGIGQVFKARFTSEEALTQENIELEYTKDLILYKIKRSVRWSGDQRPGFNVAINATKEKFGAPTSERPWGEAQQLYYYTMDGGQVIAAAELPNKPGNVSDATKCYDFTKQPPGQFNNPGNMLQQDSLYSKCGGSMYINVTADNPNYPKKGPREIASTMEITIEDPRIFLAAAQSEYNQRAKQLKDQADKAKNNGVKPVL